MLVAKLETVYQDSGDNGSSQVSFKLLCRLIFISVVTEVVFQALPQPCDKKKLIEVLHGSSSAIQSKDFLSRLIGCSSIESMFVPGRVFVSARCGL
jgi:hypothetical protein